MYPEYFWPQYCRLHAILQLLCSFNSKNKCSILHILRVNATFMVTASAMHCPFSRKQVIYVWILTICYHCHYENKEFQSITLTFIQILPKLRRNLSRKRFRNVQDIMVTKPQHETISFTLPPAQFLIMSIFVLILCLEFVSLMMYGNNKSADFWTLFPNTLCKVCEHCHILMWYQSTFSRNTGQKRFVINFSYLIFVDFPLRREKQECFSALCRS